MIPRFNSAIQPLLDELVAEGGERGLQVAAYVDGQLVLDAWAGVADNRTGAEVSADTLFPVFSVTKGMVSTALHLLAERGQLDYETPVANYWPEFAANGKAAVTVRQCMNHTAGLYRMPHDLDHAKLADWAFMVGAIAAQAPTYTPGERQVYHAMTYGWISGEILRRIDGRDFKQFLAEELNAPLGIENLFCGIPEGIDERIAWLEETGAETPDNLGNGSVPNWLQPLHAWMNRDDARRACIPASTGVMCARSMARHYAALIPGGVDGVELLPTSRLALANERQWPRDREHALKFGLGYALGGDDSTYGPNPHAFGHGGYGGAIAFADPDARLAFALCKNQLNVGDNTKRIITAFRDLLDKEH
ncbi:serine hydrolase domain-containing protein [Cerasicoccus maritimus]|uniref:serine hydrolase domain-containing protein n=1 Tax=Cerasicoccus maritimus TaxID=490089 RepID=UPI00285282D4|nr:serine hydrolase domain-containing protein [Cerasicoccus maritimus]